MRAAFIFIDQDEDQVFFDDRVEHDTQLVCIIFLFVFKVSFILFTLLALKSKKNERGSFLTWPKSMEGILSYAFCSVISTLLGCCSRLVIVKVFEINPSAVHSIT